jgi:hypothetical protein
MKKLIAVLSISFFFMICVCGHSYAQGRTERTSSARAAYGIQSGGSKRIVLKKKSSKKPQRSKQAKNKDKNPAYRKRSVWAG